MGDRISVAFADNHDESVALFSHWGGKRFLAWALDYVHELKVELKAQKKASVAPLDRLEPATMMVDFIRWLTTDKKRVESDLYLGKDYNDGDNSDNGHWVIDVNTGNIRG